MRSLNWVDVVLAIIVAANCVMGLRRGIFREVFNLAGLVVFKQVQHGPIDNRDIAPFNDHRNQFR